MSSGIGSGIIGGGTPLDHGIVSLPDIDGITGLYPGFYPGGVYPMARDNTNHHMVIRARVTAGVGRLFAALYEGGVARSGEISNTFSNTGFENLLFSLSEAEAATIVNYDNLEIHFWYDPYLAGISYEISEIYLLVPTAGTDTADSRDVRIEGFELISQPQDTRITGTATTEDSRDVRLTGEAPSAESFDTRITGETESADSRDTRLVGTATSGNIADLAIVGELDDALSTDARITGEADSDNSNDVAIQGEDTTTVAHDTRVTGEFDSSHENDVRMIGTSFTDHSNFVKIFGHIPTDHSNHIIVIGTDPVLRKIRYVGAEDGTHLEGPHQRTTKKHLYPR